MPPETYVNPRSPRGNQGCWSCRFRKKKCLRTDVNDPICDDCHRFHMECIGGGEERPRRPGLSRKARDVLKDWIKAHSKETPNPHEEPLSIRYLWETSPHSSSSQRGSQEIQVRDHRRSSSTTSTYTVSSQGSPGSSVFGFQPNALQNLIATSPGGSGDFLSLSPTQTASVRLPHGNTAASASTRQTVHHAYHATYQLYPSQPHGPGGISNAMNAAHHATAQIQNEPVSSSAYLNVPGFQDTAEQPPVNFVFTNEQGAHFDPSATAAAPLLIPGNWQESSFLEASPVSSSLLSPGSPYASSVLSSSSSYDDGSWDQAPPSPSYFSNDLYAEANQSPSTTVVTQNQGMYYQSSSPTYPTR